MTQRLHDSTVRDKLNPVLHTVLTVHIAGKIDERCVADDKEDDGFTERLDFKVSVETKRYLSALKKRKTHGNTNTAVVRRFIDDGIRLAIKEGFISLKDGEAP